LLDFALMKSLTYLLGFCSLMLVAVTCKPGQQTTTSPKNGTQITGTLNGNKADSLKLLIWDGVNLNPIESQQLTYQKDKSIFSFNTQKLNSGLYFLAFDSKKVRPFIIHNEAVVEVRGHVDSIQQFRFPGSTINERYNYYMNQNQQMSKEFQGILGEYRRFAKIPEKKAEVDAKMKDYDTRRVALYNQAKTDDPFLAKVLGLFTYLSYEFNKEGDESEGQYFAKNFFNYADLSDPVYNHLPQIRNAAQGYAQTLGKVGLTVEDQQKYVDENLAKMDEGSVAYKAFLLGVAIGYGQTKAEQNIVKYGELYLSKFSGENAKLDQDLTGRIRKAKKLMPGIQAPDIVQKNPEGEEVKLSDFKGKIVLIDFWASWCGPCRRENPNVVKVYNEFKDQGFEILGVSLDKSKAKWVSAIEKDKLTWPHVSDLKGWGSTHAKDYGVTGIPQTFLVDKEGKIIAKNLKGAQLDAQLTKLFAN